MKKTIILCLVTALLFSLAACTPGAVDQTTSSQSSAASEEVSQAPSASDAGGENPINIGVDYATSDIFNLQVYNTVKAAGDEEGWTVFGAEGQRDAEKTLSNVDSFITKKADYILIVGVDLALEESIQEKCDNAGVSVAYCAGDSDPTYTTLAGAGSWIEVGTQIATYLAQKAQEEWDGVVDLPVITTNLAIGQIGQDIVTACTDTWVSMLGINADDVIIIDCGWDNAKASELFTNLLTAHPEAKHIIAFSFVDLHHGVPLYNAAKAAGRLDQLIMGGTNTADESTAQCMQESPNTWVCQLPMSGNVPGATFVEIVKAAINGTPFEKKVYNPTVEESLATPENIADYYE